MVSEEYNILFAGINCWIIFLYPINNQLNRISSIMTYHQILIHKVKTTDPTIGAGTVHSVLLTIVCLFVLYLMVIILSVLRFTVSDCMAWCVQPFLNCYTHNITWQQIHNNHICSYSNINKYLPFKKTICPEMTKILEYIHYCCIFFD